MTRRSARDVVREIKRKVQEGHYRLTDHALEEMDDEDILDADMLWAIRNGGLRARMTNDPRGARYVLRGTVPDGRELEAVCRLAGGKVRILTVYLVE